MLHFHSFRSVLTHFVNFDSTYSGRQSLTAVLYNFATKEPKWVMIMSGKFVDKRKTSASSAEEHSDSYRLQGDCEVKVVVTR